MTPTTFLVSNFTDTGTGTLRAAIQAANNNPGPDAITFSMSPFGLIGIKTIQLNSPLVITDTVNINGSQGGFSLPGFPALTHNPGIQILAAPVNSSSNDDELVLKVDADGCNLNGLIIRQGVTAGILVLGDNNIIRNCFVGTTATGNADGGSQGIGILIRGSDNIIGGPNAANRNVVSGNGSGVVISGFSGGGDGNTVQGNFIGTDLTGTIAIPNSTGIFMSAFSTNNLITGNVISGNFDGIRAVGPNVATNTVRSNRIGVATDGITPLGNTQNGILVAGGAHNNLIGGPAVGDANTIAFNGLRGVVIGDVISHAFGLAGVGNRVQNNFIFANFPIDLGATDGTTANDPFDADTGPNNLQNTPVLTSVGPSGGNAVVVGGLNTVPNTPIQLDFFSSSSVVAGVPQNLALLFSFPSSSDAGGNIVITSTVPAIPAGTTVFMAVTNLNTGDTSEFSNGVVMPNNPPMIKNDVLTPNINEGQFATLSGNLVDPDPGDALTLRVNWGDGSPIKEYHPGLDPFAFQLRYTDDGVYSVNFTWLDNHGGSNTRTRQVTVHNVAPEIHNLDLHPDDPHVNQQVVLTGRIVDPGDDTFALTINWGDGTVETVERDHDGEFHVKHRYTNAGHFTIQLTATDDDGGSIDRSLGVDVHGA